MLAKFDDKATPHHAGANLAAQHSIEIQSKSIMICIKTLPTFYAKTS